jgi:hypothetical protein
MTRIGGRITSISARRAAVVPGRPSIPTGAPGIMSRRGKMTAATRASGRGMTPAPDMRAGGVPTPGMSAAAVSAAARARLRRPRRRREHAPEDRDRNRQCSVHAFILLGLDVQ